MAEMDGCIIVLEADRLVVLLPSFLKDRRLQYAFLVGALFREVPSNWSGTNSVLLLEFLKRLGAGVSAAMY